MMTATDGAVVKKRPKRKKGIAGFAQRRPKLFYGGLGGIAFVSYVLWWGFQPITGPLEYGICRAYIELKQIYPTTITINRVDYFDRSVRIYYTARGTFGEQRARLIDCRYMPPGSAPHPQLEQIQELNQRVRIAEPKEAVARFNASIPAIIAAEPDLRVPAPSTGTLESLKID